MEFIWKFEFESDQTKETDFPQDSVIISTWNASEQNAEDTFDQTMRETGHTGVEILKFTYEGKR